MSIHQLSPLRRIVTANGPDGRSSIVEDGHPPATVTVDERPGYRSTNVWRTIDGPTSVEAGDSTLDHRGVLPPTGGTVIRVIDIPPRHPDPAIRKQQASASLAKLFPDADHQADNPQPGMHVTKTIDYAIVLSGTITSIQDENETDMQAGDILIQRATNHAWENRTDEMARICFILIDGK